MKTPSKQMEVLQLSDLDLNGTYTYADYMNWKFAERVELMWGKIFKMSPTPNMFHQKVATRLTSRLEVYFSKHSCEAFVAPFDVRLPQKNGSGKNPSTVVQPDICVICDLSKLDVQGCNGAPDWVIEILSPGNTSKEMREKFQVYQESGVREYWIVDPMEKNVTSYVLNDEGLFIGKPPYIEIDTDAFPYIFPELKINLQEIFDLSWLKGR
ncbi:Uma2 family endonuclease [bacterium]|nr:Uma2 family endonuclease [bacterium]